MLKATVRFRILVASCVFTWLYGARAGELAERIQTWPGNPGPMSFVQCLSGGDRVLSSSVKVWRLSDGALLERRSYEISAMSADESTAALFREEEVQVLSTSDWSVTSIYKSNMGEVLCVALSPAAEWVFAGTEYGDVARWSVSDGALKKNVRRSHTGFVRAVAVSPDGLCVASGGSDGRVVLTRLDTMERIWTINPMQGAVTAVAFSPDSARILFATATSTGRINICKTEDGTIEREHSVSGRPRAMRWSHGGERYAAGGTGGLLTVWDDATGEVVAALDSSSDVYSFDFTVEGNGLVTGDSDAVLLHWSIADQRVIRQFNEGFRGKITHVGISETGAIIASRSSEKMIRLWSPGIDRPLAEMTSDDEVRTFRLAPSARHLALWQERQHTGVWTHLPDNPTFVPLSEEEDLVGIEFAHHTEQVFGLYYNYGFWNINDGVLERDYYFHERNREILALSPDDQFVAMPGDYEPLILFRLGDEDKIWKSDADIPYTGAIKFSHDGNDIAVNGKYGVHLIDAATGIERWKADQPERYWHYFPTFSLDGRFVLGGGRGKVHIWSRTDGEPLHTIQVPDSEFAYGLTAVADNAKRFAVGFADGSVELWRILALPRPADLNCDDCVDFNDIDPFVLALSGEDAYQKAFPNCRWLNADLDNDGAVDLDDVDPFVALLAEGQ